MGVLVVPRDFVDRFFVGSFAGDTNEHRAGHRAAARNST